MKFKNTHINKRNHIYLIISIWISVFVSFSGFSQDKKQLEKKRIKLQKEIKQINRLLATTKKTEKNLVSRLFDINKKIEIRQNLIDVINAESQAYLDEINNNKTKIGIFEVQLKTLKKSYANMVVQTYKGRNSQNKLLFLLSSKSFTQAYRRLQYFKQFESHRKEKAKNIITKKIELVSLNDSLKIKKQTKDVLIAKKLAEKKIVDLEKIEQQKLIDKVKKDEKKYVAQIRKKQRAERNFERQIENLISGVIAKSNKKKGIKSKTFNLTPDAKKLATSFVSSKGNLPHPVEKGYISRRFGTRSHEQLKGIKVKSNGWHYITGAKAQARSVFKGTVFAILVDKKTKLKTVIIQHGNYLTTYKNLTDLLVAKGDNVLAKQDLGVIHTDKTTGKTKLVFSLWKNMKTQNPAYWLKK